MLAERGRNNNKSAGAASADLELVVTMIGLVAASANRLTPLAAPVSTIVNTTGVLRPGFTLQTERVVQRAVANRHDHTNRLASVLVFQKRYERVLVRGVTKYS